MKRRQITFTLTAALMLAGTSALLAGTRGDVLADLAAAAGTSNFDAARGRQLFMATHTGGKPDTPSCTTCHGNDLRKGGQTRAGKPIEPMAVSANPERFTDIAKVEKWFRRNCNSVLGRECSAQEKGDLITWLSSL